jgi:hypothetical protein
MGETPEDTVADTSYTCKLLYFKIFQAILKHFFFHHLSGNYHLNCPVACKLLWFEWK